MNKLEDVIREQVCHEDYYWILCKDFCYIGSKSSMVISKKSLDAINEAKEITIIEVQNNHVILYFGMMDFPLRVGDYLTNKPIRDDLIKWNC